MLGVRLIQGAPDSDANPTDVVAVIRFQHLGNASVIVSFRV